MEKPERPKIRYVVDGQPSGKFLRWYCLAVSFGACGLIAMYLNIAFVLPAVICAIILGLDVWGDWRK